MEPPLESAAIVANARALQPEIRAAADEIESSRRLPQQLVDRMSEAGVFRIAMPRAWGGPELNPLAQIEVIEAISRADASAGWCTSILSDSGFYAAYLGEDTARKTFAGLDCKTAGMLAPIGRAEIVDGGYRVSGDWAFGSGSLHADVICGGCLLTRGGELVLENDLPAWRVTIFEREDVEVRDTWHVTGLAGTGSNHYSVRDAFVPEEKTFDVFAGSARPEPLYQYHGLFFANIPGVPLGLGRAAIDALTEIAKSKRSMPSMKLLREEYRVKAARAEAEACLGSARSYVWDVMGELWETLLAGDRPSLDQRAKLALMIIHTHRSAQRAVDLACEAVGADALYRDHPLERIRRDAIGVGSHLVHQRKSFATVGTVLLGDEPGPVYF
jgi:alkylation response protein AidB-like acyl-CoA dehydrogenase